MNKEKQMELIGKLIKLRAKTPIKKQQTINNVLSLLYNNRWQTRKDNKYYY